MEYRIMVGDRVLRRIKVGDPIPIDSAMLKVVRISTCGRFVYLEDNDDVAVSVDELVVAPRMKRRY